jgi:hypothetical protein
MSKKAFRYRFADNKMEVDTMSDAPFGQWGLTEDENGQLYYSNAGGEVGALGYQQHPSYGVLNIEGGEEEGFKEVWPVVGTPDVQGGEERLREDGTLNHFTGTCGQSIFLGNALPAYGDFFMAEPVGRLVRRAKVDMDNGKKVLRNAYPQAEFLAATDMNFRPVDTKTGPDGCLYVVDMYRGIIQEATWVKDNAFLRPVVERKKLDKNIGKGRIYRIVHDQMTPSKVTPLLDKPSSELVAYLGHPNGWSRLNAQKLLVLRKDNSTIPALENILKKDYKSLKNSDFLFDKALARLHALWTLEGLEAVTPDMIVHQLKDTDARVKRAALRISDRYLKQGNNEVFAALEDLESEKDLEVLHQLVLSLRSTKNPKAKTIVQSLMNNYPDSLMIHTLGKVNIENIPSDIAALKEKIKLESDFYRKSTLEGYKIYKSLCAACHGLKGEGIGNTAPSLIGSPRLKTKPAVAIKILLDGMTGPIDGKKYTGLMAGMKYQDDPWITAVVNYIRFGLNDEKPIGVWEVTGVREQTKERDTYWTLEELRE